MLDGILTPLEVVALFTAAFVGCLAVGALQIWASRAPKTGGRWRRRFAATADAILSGLGEGFHSL